MPTPNEENHSAKKAANQSLKELNKKLDLLSNTNTTETELPPGDSVGERIERFSEELEEELDRAQEAINSNRILEADTVLRRLNHRIKKVVSDVNLVRDMLNLTKAVNNAKREITDPPLPGGVVQPGDRR